MYAWTHTMFAASLLLTWATIDLTSSTKDCPISKDCFGELIDESVTINCYGSESCREATIDGSASINCYASFSCYDALYISHTTSSGGINCHGLFSCSNVDRIESESELISCRGEQSCSDSNIAMVLSSATDNIDCEGSQSCMNSNISTTSGVRLIGTLSFANGVLETQPSDTDTIIVTITGSEAGYGATIICNDKCDVFCYGADACTNTTFECAEGSSCEFTFDCESAFKSDVCPNGFELPDEFDFPSMRNVKFSTMNDTFSTCNLNTSSFTSISCGDFEDENCFQQTVLETTTEDPGPICCSGQASCSQSTTITAVFEPQEDFYTTCFRSDARSGANGIKNSINCPSGGDMYFTGYGSGSNTINGNGLNDVYVTAFESFAALTNPVINNINDLYCLARSACQEVTFNDINGDVYAAGTASLRQSVVKNVAGDFYCLAGFSCYLIEIDNVEGNVIAASYWVTRNAKITNVAGTLLSYGYNALTAATVTNVSSLVVNGFECLMNAVIRGLTKLEVSGTKAMNGAVIVSESPTGFFEAILSGDNNETSEIYCSESDFCVIDCASVNGCNFVELYCNGTCWVKCDESNGFNCPDDMLDVNIYSTNSEVCLPTEFKPTISPSNFPSNEPSADPTSRPSDNPSMEPSIYPTRIPSVDPTSIPSNNPTNDPSARPTDTPTQTPSFEPSYIMSTDIPISIVATLNTANNDQNSDQDGVSASSKDCESESSETELIIIIIILSIFLAAVLILLFISYRKNKTLQNMIDNDLALAKASSINTKNDRNKAMEAAREQMNDPGQPNNNVVKNQNQLVIGETFNNTKSLQGVDEELYGGVGNTPGIEMSPVYMMNENGLSQREKPLGDTPGAFVTGPGGEVGEKPHAPMN